MLPRVLQLSIIYHELLSIILCEKRLIRFPNVPFLIRLSLLVGRGLFWILLSACFFDVAVPQDLGLLACPLTPTCFPVVFGSSFCKPLQLARRAWPVRGAIPFRADSVPIS